jgi:transposase
MHLHYHFIGLDVHKKTVAFCEMRADGQMIASGTFKTTRTAIAQWAAQRTQPWIGAMEATLFTGYLYDMLTPHAVEIQVGHPARIKAISTAKHKNDAADAETLANLLRADLFPQCHMAPTRVRELRRVLRFRNFFVRQAVSMKNRTTGILMETGVEYDARKIHRQRYFNELLDNLEDVPNSVRELLCFTRAGLEMFQATQKKLVDALVKLPELHERVERLMTIDGVGEITALTWALEIDDPRRFANLKQVQSYCGLCSGQNESAGKSKNGPLSKQRNANLQTMLIEAAKLAPRWNAQLSQVHARSLAQDKNKNRATCAVARKLVAYLMAVDKSGEPYQDRSSEE